MDRAVIDMAKRDLQTKDKSLSGLIEDYFKLLINTKARRSPNAPIVAELTGLAVSGKKVDEGNLITEYLLDKYK